MRFLSGRSKRESARSNPDATLKFDPLPVQPIIPVLQRPMIMPRVHGANQTTTFASSSNISQSFHFRSDSITPSIVRTTPQPTASISRLIPSSNSRVTFQPTNATVRRSILFSSPQSINQTSSLSLPPSVHLIRQHNLSNQSASSASIPPSINRNSSNQN